MFLCVLWCIRYSIRIQRFSLGESAEYIRSSITKTLDSFTVVAEFSQRQDAWDCLNFGEHLSIVKCFLCLWVLCTSVHSAARIRIWSFCGKVMSRTPTKQNNCSPEMARRELPQIWGFVAIPLLPNQDGSLNFAILQHAEQLGDVEELCGDLGRGRYVIHKRYQVQLLSFSSEPFEPVFNGGRRWSTAKAKECQCEWLHDCVCVTCMKSASATIVTRVRRCHFWWRKKLCWLKSASQALRTYERLPILVSV